MKKYILVWLIGFFVVGFDISIAQTGCGDPVSSNYYCSENTGSCPFDFSQGFPVFFLPDGFTVVGSCIYDGVVENEDGIPDLAHRFKQQFKNSDAVVISFAEHNASYTSAFKNIFDWISRIDKNIWHNKPMFLLATSTGGNGAVIVLEAAFSRISRRNTNHISTFSLPNFNENFNDNLGITDPKLKSIFESKLNEFISKM